MRIGIDLDEVLANFLDPLLRFHNEIYSTSLKRDDFKSYNFWETWGGTREQAIQKVLDFYKSDYFKNIKPFEGAIESIEELSKDNELLIITSRYKAISEETEKWINKYFPDNFSGIHFTNEFFDSFNNKRKHEICLDLEINSLVEDSLEYAQQCASNGINILLMDRPWNRGKLQEGIIRVHSWKEITDYLTSKNIES